MPLVFAAIAPHGGLAVEELVAPEDRDVALATRRGFEELARRFDAAAPDSVVVLTPHGIHVEGAMAVVTSGKLVGELKEGGARQMRFDPNAGERSISLTVPTDRDLMRRCLDAIDAAGVRAVGISYGGNDAATGWSPMDWAVLIPLWFMGGRREEPVPAVSISPARDLSFEAHVRAGEALRDAFEAYPKRVALVASCDHGHAHDKNGPYGYHQAARQFDAQVVDIVRKNELAKLLDFDAGFVGDAKADSYWQMLMLHGALRRDGWRAELLSYEAPTYFGMLCASYVPM